VLKRNKVPTRVRVIRIGLNPIGITFDTSNVKSLPYAFNYNNVNIKRPIVGTGLIIDSIPVLEPMVLDSKGDWVR
jgi:hypothetical protein